ncbi:Amidophosphoribosyltransferase [Polychaeton citri CBS 116435]|uniref:Amidophosphoribosyltransferase n=1 Tax=Polychaeton citri CBS 116435 TaxID=1314669 RepID=A0A9P4Q3N6_9PEZI|nr:Amidophosphoribosyltransferase [Polychaeton citri CBS 116435]
MCGIAGLLLGNSLEDVAVEVIEALYQLQHRGQDACGVAIANLGQAGECTKGKGLLSEVFAQSSQTSSLKGNIGIGHVRYRTAGLLTENEAQPISNRGRPEIFFAHNGHVSFPRTAGYQTTSPGSDSHGVLSILASTLEKIDLLFPQESLAKKVLRTLRGLYSRCDGSFACVAMVDAKLLVGFRDPYAIKPLVLGQRQRCDGLIDYMLASESVALEKLDFEIVRDVAPGEAVIIEQGVRSQTTVQFHQIVPVRTYTPDIFELVYFARPESTLDGISVQECRQRMGHALAQTALEELGADTCFQIDAVVPVPDSGYVSALALSQSLNIPLALGLVRNQYCQRTFILPGHEKRLKAVRRKLSPVASEFAGRNVLIVDDSIVRGSTSREIVRMARKAGARKVVFASSSPAIRFNHIHGIDLADRRELVAYGRSNKEIAECIGADAVLYLPLDRLVGCCRAAQGEQSEVDGFEVGVFTGNYVNSGAETLQNSITAP